MKVAAADSGAALLDPHFKPVQIVATAAVVVGPPYREASSFRAKPAFASVENGNLLIIRELELCNELLKDVRADVIHLDMSLGGVLVEEISPVHLRGKARSSVLKILPKIRKLSTNIKRVYGIDVVALGKNSVPVRIAELTTGAHAVLYSCERCLEDGRAQILGLPSKCRAETVDNKVMLHSLIAAEQDLTGYANDDKGLLSMVSIKEMLNPCARGFWALRIIPK